MIITDNLILETRTHLINTPNEYIVLRVLRGPEVVAVHTSKDWGYINKRVDFYRNSDK